MVFDDMIPHMISNKKLKKTIVAELFIRGKKLNISTVFITETYFQVPKDVRINCTYFFIMKIPKTIEGFNKSHFITRHILALKTL